MGEPNRNNIITSDIRRNNNITLLLDLYTTESRELQESFILAGYDIPAVVIEDDGFLPNNVTSVYGYYLGDYASSKGSFGKPRYFNQLEIPAFWEISSNNTNGEIHDKNKLRAKIFYADPRNKRMIRSVDWYDEAGIVRYSEHYNKYGVRWAVTVFDIKGQHINKSFFDASGREIILENYATGNIILNDGDEIRIFDNKTEFVKHFLKTSGLLRERLFFNSLSTPFFVSLALEDNGGEDVLFWQEPTRDDIPGNMQVIFRGEAARCKKVIVQRYNNYKRLIDLGAPRSMTKPLGNIYRYERDSSHRKEALICTNSDRVEGLGVLADAFPDIKFNVAALTEMSSKLLSFGSRDNVKLYPGAKDSTFDELFADCDIYLDINHENEIVDALHRAYLNNMLIFGFADTSHSRDYVAGEHLVSGCDAGALIELLRGIVRDEAVWDSHLEMQRKAALAQQSDDFEF